MSCSRLRITIKADPLEIGDYSASFSICLGPFKGIRILTHNNGRSVLSILRDACHRHAQGKEPTIPTETLKPRFEAIVAKDRAHCEAIGPLVRAKRFSLKKCPQ